MSLMKSATRRLSLLAGSSLVAASLGATVFTGASMAPTAAHAYDECTVSPTATAPPTLSDGPGGVSDPTLNDPGLVTRNADSYACTLGTYATGITYSSHGDLTVTKTNTGTTTVTANGVNLTGNGADSVAWDSSVGIVSGGAGTAGPVIDVLTASGDINISTRGVTATQASATHAIKAVSTGGGDIVIANVVNGLNNSGAGGQAVIEAISNGGDISITSTGGINGRARGILAQTSGSGTLTVNADAAVTVSTTAGLAAIEATTGTGALSISITRGVTDGGGGPAIRAVSGGGVTVNVQGFGGIGLNNAGGNASVDFSGVSAGGVTFSISNATDAVNGRWYATDASRFSSQNDVLTMSGIGQNRMDQGASIDFGAGADTFTLNGKMDTETGSALYFGAGADVLNVSGQFSTSGTTLDFGNDTDTFNMSGVWAINSASITGLETFSNTGVILMGAGLLGGANTVGQHPVPNFTTTDGFGDDILVLDGGTFTGSGDSRVLMDAHLALLTQTGCDALTGAGDCLDFRGASTAGSTLITINNIAPPSETGAYNPVGVTLVDVGGVGTSAAEHFVLDPGSAGYVDDPILGGAIDRPGLFRYALQYDVANQRHVLVGLPKSQALEYAMLSGAAQSVWHMTSETVTDRQTDLRAGMEGALWMRAAGEYTKRDVTSTFDSLGQTFAVDNSYKLYAGTIMVGSDLISGSMGGFDHVIGFQVGYVSSSFDLTASESSGRFTGWTGGSYASLWNDWFFLDGAVNVNGLTLDYDSPALGSKTNTFINSVGGSAEAGLRSNFAEGLFVEPLASLAYVRTSFEEISLFGGEAQPDDATSLRGALGLRLGGTLSGELASATYFVTGRAWNEFEGESGGVVGNPGVGLPFADEFSGAFGEAEAGVNVHSASGALTGFLTSGVKFKDGYSAVNLALGVRMAW